MVKSRQKTTIINNHIICKCGEDLGEVSNSKGYLCENCEIVYFTSENAVEELTKINKGIKPKRNVLDWVS